MTEVAGHQLDYTQIICTSFQIDNTASTSTLNCHMPYALHDTQPSVSLRLVNVVQIFKKYKGRHFKDTVKTPCCN